MASSTPFKFKKEPTVVDQDTATEIIKRKFKPKANPVKFTWQGARNFLTTLTGPTTMKLDRIRDLTENDIAERKLPKDTSGVVVTEIYDQSPLLFVSVNDVIVELQKKKITSSKQFSKLIKEIIKKGAKTLYLAIYNSNNQRSYITVKLK